LKEKVLGYDILPDELVVMDVKVTLLLKIKDLANNDLIELRKKLAEDSFNSKRSDWDSLQECNISGLYRCGKCKESKTTYFQLQTRRADEGMTTYYFIMTIDMSNALIAGMAGECDLVE